MSVSCQFSGRLGNCVYNICQVIAYAKKYNLDYWFPSYAWACIDQKVPVHVPNTGQPPVNPVVYNEPKTGINPYYQDIPYMEHVEFRGYFQSFKYFENYRQDILDITNFPHETEYGIVAIGVRRGDAVGQPEGFPMAPMEYYHTAIEYMQAKGYNKFRLYTDDNPWCKEEFTTERYSGAEFEFYEGSDILQKYISLTQVEHHIIPRSTFDLTAAWFNRNPNKIILCPSIDQHYWWIGQNLDLLKGTEHWLTQLRW